MRLSTLTLAFPPPHVLVLLHAPTTSVPRVVDVAKTETEQAAPGRLCRALLLNFEVEKRKQPREVKPH